MVASACIVFMVLIAFLAPVIASRSPLKCRYEERLYFPAVANVVRQIPWVSGVLGESPFVRAGFDAKAAAASDESAWWAPIPFGPLETSESQFARPSWDHWLGTDEVGRDVAARLIHGTVVSLQVGMVSMGIAGVIGVLLGAFAGYFGGWTDMVISRLIEAVICFPVFFLILSVMVWLEPSIVNVMVVLGLTRWTSIARFTRGEFIRLKQADFVTAARATGSGPLRIMFREMLPNAAAPVLVTVTFGVAQAILIEAGLSWLGFGVQPPSPSWGNLLRSAFVNLHIAPHLVFPPCVAIFAAVLVYNTAGDALRDAADPRIHSDF